MFFIVLSLVSSYTIAYQVKPKSGFIVLLQRWGFEENGSYNITFWDVDGVNSTLALVAKRDDAITYIDYVEELAKKSDFEEIDFCPDFHVNYSNVVMIENGTGSVSGTIDKKGMYYTIVSSCSKYDNGYKFRLVYKNPNSCLSYDEKPLLITVPVVTSLIGLIFILWIINWVLHFSCKNSLHIYFTAGITLSAIYYILYTFEVISSNKTDIETPVYTARRVFRVFQETILLSAMLMAAEGWCIVKNTISWWSVLLSFACSACVTISFAIVEFLYLNTVETVIALIFVVVASCTYMVVLFININSGRQHIVAHLYVIAEEGIDPVTTPIYKKLQLYQSVASAVICYFMVIMVRTLIQSFYPLQVWITQLLYDLIIIILIAIISFFFRMKKETSNGYMMLGDEDQEPRVFSAQDIQHINYNNVEGSNRPYEEGMHLPAQPFITKSKKKENKSNDENESRNQELLGDDVNL